jgi:hypothetical protein
MRRRAHVPGSIAVALLAGLALRAAAGDDIATFFPLQVGHSWTYHLKITAGKTTKSIEYTTKVVRKEELDDAPGLPCFVLENRSDERMFETSWFGVDGARLVQARRTSGRTTHALCVRDGDAIGAVGRVLLDGAAIAALPKRTSWAWASKEGSQRGTVTLEGRERLRLRNFGELDCLVLGDDCTSTVGDKTATIKRRLWLAAGLGLVQERARAEADGTSTETEATLIRHEAP